MTRTAMAVVRKKVKKAHLKLPVSFLMVNKVVPQGKCNRENNMVAMAVSQVQPLLINILCKVSRLSGSIIILDERYPINRMGITISLAGKARMKARRMKPSSPMSLAKGSRKAATS